MRLLLAAAAAAFVAAVFASPVRGGGGASRALQEEEGGGGGDGGGGEGPATDPEPLLVRCASCFTFGPSCATTRVPTALLPGLTGAFGGTVSGTTSGPSLLPGPYGGPEAFFTIDIPEDLAGGTLVLNTCGSSFDTVLEVFASCPREADTLFDLALVAVNDDALTGPCVGTLQSFVAVEDLRAGTYYIAVDGFAPSSRGAFTLTYSVVRGTTSSGCACGSMGRTCSIPLPITPLDGIPGVVNTVRGTLVPGPSLIPGSFAGAENVFSLVIPPGTASVVLSTCGGALFDTVLHVVRDCPRGLIPVSGLGLVATNDDACGLQSRIVLSSPPPGTYFVILEGFSEGAGGSYALSYEVSSTPLTL